MQVENWLWIGVEKGNFELSNSELHSTQGKLRDTRRFVDHYYSCNYPRVI